MIDKTPLSGIRNNAVFILLLVAACLILYFPSLSYFFAQDDFFFLNRAENISTHHLFSILQPVGPFYRPVSTVSYFWVMLRLFGLHPLPFHIASIVLFCANTLLVGSVGSTLFRNRTAGFITALFYLTRSVHFETVSWVSGIQELLMTFFLLVSLILYFRFAEGRKWFLLPSLISFALALLSKETAFVFPFLVLLFELLHIGASADRKRLFSVALFFAAAIVAFLTRYLFLPKLAREGEYITAIGPFWISHFFTYATMSLNALFLAILKLPRFRGYLMNGAFTGPVLALLVLCLFYALFKKREEGSRTEEETGILRRNLLFGLGIFGIGILPALQFQNHIEPYYASFASLGVSIALAAGTLSVSNRKVRAALPAAAFVIALATNVQLRSGKVSHVGRYSPVAKQAICRLSQVLKDQPQGRTLYISGADEYLWRALAKGDGIKVFFPEIDRVVFDTLSPDYQLDGSEIVFVYKK